MLVVLVVLVMVVHTVAAAVLIKLQLHMLAAVVRHTRTHTQHRLNPRPRAVFASQRTVRTCTALRSLQARHSATVRVRDSVTVRVRHSVRVRVWHSVRVRAGIRSAHNSIKQPPALPSAAHLPACRGLPRLQPGPLKTHHSRTPAIERPLHNNNNHSSSRSNHSSNSSSNHSSSSSSARRSVRRKACLVLQQGLRVPVILCRALGVPGSRNCTRRDALRACQRARAAFQLRGRAAIHCAALVRLMSGRPARHTALAMPQARRTARWVRRERAAVHLRGRALLQGTFPVFWGRGRAAALRHRLGKRTRRKHTHRRCRAVCARGWAASCCRVSHGRRRRRSCARASRRGRRTQRKSSASLGS